MTERKIHPSLISKTEGFLFRAFDKFKGTVGFTDELQLASEFPPDPVEQQRMKETTAEDVFVFGLDFIANHVADPKLQETVLKAKDEVVMSRIHLAYPGVIPEPVMLLMDDDTFIEPPMVEDESPYFVVTESPHRQYHIIIPELWLVNAVSFDASLRVEALAILAHTATYFDGYQSRSHLKGDIMTALARAIGMPKPQSQEEFYATAEKIYRQNLEEKARKNVGLVLKQAFKELDTPDFRWQVQESLGFPNGRYVPSGEPFRSIFYKK